MELSLSSEADSHSASQEIPRLLWNPMVHYRVQKSSRSDPNLRQPNPVRPTDPYLLKAQLNVIFPSTPWSS